MGEFILDNWEGRKEGRKWSREEEGKKIQV